MAGVSRRTPNVLVGAKDLTQNTGFDFDIEFTTSGDFAGLVDPNTMADLDWNTLTGGTGFTAINSASANSTQTVSPKDLFQSLDSASPSTAFTNLTTPDMGPSPEFEYDTSPAFQDNLDYSANGDNWFPLFPDANNDTATAPTVMARNISQQSLGASSSSNSPMTLTNSLLTKASSVSQSPLPRNASISVSKARRRKGPLKPIEVDPGDKVATKRARNTLAARESRARKLEYVERMELELAAMEAEKDAWKSEAVARGAPADLH